MFKKRLNYQNEMEELEELEDDPEFKELGDDDFGETENPKKNGGDSDEYISEEEEV